MASVQMQMTMWRRKFLTPCKQAAYRYISEALVYMSICQCRTPPSCIAMHSKYPMKFCGSSQTQQSMIYGWVAPPSSIFPHWPFKMWSEAADFWFARRKVRERLRLLYNNKAFADCRWIRGETLQLKSSHNECRKSLACNTPTAQSVSCVSTSFQVAFNQSSVLR